MDTRLKKYNCGATLYLYESDILIVNSTRGSSGIHQVKTIVNADGCVEHAEYFLTPSQSNEFRHLVSKIDEAQLSDLSDAIAELGEAEERINFASIDFDPFQYEAKGLRCLRYWHNGKRCQCSTVRTSFYADLAIPHDVSQRFISAFDQIFLLLDEYVPESKPKLNENASK